FKRDVIALVDDVEESARAVDAVNTIVNDDGHLTASNTDYIAVRSLIADNHLDADAPVVIRGSGGLATAGRGPVRGAGFAHGTLVAGNPKAGRELAERLGYTWRTDQGSVTAPVIVNATPIGMAGADEHDKIAFDTSVVERAEVVFDVVAVPAQTPLIAA